MKNLPALLASLFLMVSASAFAGELSDEDGVIPRRTDGDGTYEATRQALSLGIYGAAARHLRLALSGATSGSPFCKTAVVAVLSNQRGSNSYEEIVPFTGLRFAWKWWS
jgi:hypothetical protein